MVPICFKLPFILSLGLFLLFLGGGFVLSTVLTESRPPLVGLVLTPCFCFCFYLLHVNLLRTTLRRRGQEREVHCEGNSVAGDERFGVMEGVAFSLLALMAKEALWSWLSELQRRCSTDKTPAGIPPTGHKWGFLAFFFRSGAQMRLGLEPLGDLEPFYTFTLLTGVL